MGTRTIVLGTLLVVIIALVTGLIIWKLSKKSDNNHLVTYGTEILNLSKDLYDLEVKNNDIRLYTIEYQAKSELNDKFDRAPQSLFHLPSDGIFWNQSQTLRLLKPIYEKYRLNSTVYGPEHMQEEWNFLEAILQTPIMLKTMEFLNSQTVSKNINDSNKDKKSKDIKSEGHNKHPNIQSSTTPKSVLKKVENFISNHKNVSNLFQKLNHTLFHHSTSHHPENKTVHQAPKFKNSSNHSTSHPDSKNQFHHVNHTILHHSTSHHPENKTVHQAPKFKNSSNHSTSHPDPKNQFHYVNHTILHHSTSHHPENKTVHQAPRFKNTYNHSTSNPGSKNQFHKLNHTKLHHFISHHRENKTTQQFPNSRTDLYQPASHPDSKNRFHKLNRTTSHDSTSNHSKNKTIHRIPNIKKKYWVQNSTRSTSRHIPFHKQKSTSNSNKWYSNLKSKIWNKPLLRPKRDVGSTRQQQIDFLRKIWFTNSAGNINMRGSGFEKAFMGSLIAGTNVTGFHNWIYFAEEERLGNLDYKGYVKYTPLGNRNQHFVATVRLAFHNVTSPRRTLFIGTSPELEMSLYTACFVLNKKGKCSVDLGGKRINVNISKGLLHHNKQKYIAAAYPEIV